MSAMGQADMAPYSDVRFGSLFAAPSHGTLGCFTQQSCRVDARHLGS
jgi:hypothetical protein